MVRRLVLGCSLFGGDLLRTLTDRPGSVTVVTNQKGRAEDLRAEGIDALSGDPTDRETFPDSADVVVVAGDDPVTNRDAAAAARDNFPDAVLVVHLGGGPSNAIRDELVDLADEVIDPRQAVLDRVGDAIGTTQSERIYRLMRVLRNLDGPLAVVMHDNPDPDAIASAVALQAIAKRANVEATACYFGDISHQENRALVNLLELDLHEFDETPNLDEYDGIALVDHSRPGVNDRLPPDTVVDIVIDHHPPREPVEAAYVDLRRRVGATSTVLAEYLDRLGIVPDEHVATALLFGIRVDTNDFTREVSTADFEAAAWLVPHVNTDLLQRVETPSMTSETMETLARAISNRDQRGPALTSNVGDVRDRDAIAQACDYLLGMEGVDIAIVYGLMDGTVYVSGRTRGTAVDLGEVLRDALGSIGSAGGHADMAGAQIPLGILDAVGGDSRESLATIVTDIVAGRIFETLEHAPAAPTLDSDVAFEFPLDE
ncbi:DHH family phosphoesterase [Haloferax larsenii]|uniref:NanoRNase/pAp phosphatase, hydrolyzes c-di-AMP and oligoRNAs n=1 Tax=Haloferax larsenii TaxID=302484 RepID=A0A1H7HND6_HALLR|nr:DHH family phosphoesterase [Haloferax larsenii]SEK51167.1 nanoRNase/pAp phosphatase, hydrolyzes c-di-AMP and oligoRNAs [Haloferax larsenii]